MSDSKLVLCGTHGETPSTFVCRHLVGGVACGYHASADDIVDPWPDAWCDRCDEAFQAAGGEWNDESEGVADIQLLCTHCYEARRTSNRQPPPLARGARARLSSDEADALLHHATHEIRITQAASDMRWGLRGMASWNFDDGTRTLTFSDPEHPSITADVRLVGSYSTKSSTFQWAWATFDEGAPEAHDISKLRVFGEVRGLAKLTTANWTCDEVDGWEMTSLAGYLLGTEAVYCAPFDHLRWFMLLSNLRLEHGSEDMTGGPTVVSAHGRT